MKRRDFPTVVEEDSVLLEARRLLDEDEPMGFEKRLFGVIAQNSTQEGVQSFLKNPLIQQLGGFFCLGFVGMGLALLFDDD